MIDLLLAKGPMDCWS